MDPIQELEREQLRTDIPQIAPGDTVRVSVKVVEGSRERVQVFEGTVMRMRGGGVNQTCLTANPVASKAASRTIQPQDLIDFIADISAVLTHHLSSHRPAPCRA